MRKIIVLFLFVICPYGCENIAVEQPKINVFKDKMEPILGKVVFVTKNIYMGQGKGQGGFTGDLYFKGKVRNVTKKPIKNVIIMWCFWDKNQKVHSYGIFPYKIDYLDSKAEEEFSIPVLLYSGMGSDISEKVDASYRAERYEIFIYTMKD